MRIFQKIFKSDNLKKHFNEILQNSRFRFPFFFTDSFLEIFRNLIIASRAYHHCTATASLGSADVNITSACIRPPVRLSIHPSIHLSIHPSIHPASQPSIRLFVCVERRRLTLAVAHEASLVASLKLVKLVHRQGLTQLYTRKGDIE